MVNSMIKIIQVKLQVFWMNKEVRDQNHLRKVFKWVILKKKTQMLMFYQ